MTLPTKNPIPSGNILDQVFNAEKLDEVVNSDNETYSDRLDVKRFTISGLTALVKNLIASISGTSGASKVGTSDTDTVQNKLDVAYTNLRSLVSKNISDLGLTLSAGSFEEGGTVQSPSDVLWHKETNKCFIWTGDYPKQVDKSSLPDDQWDEVLVTVNRLKIFNQGGPTSGIRTINFADSSSSQVIVSPTGMITTRYSRNGLEFSPVTCLPYTREMNRTSVVDGLPLRELIIPAPGASDNLNSPKLSFITTKNKKVEVWAVHPDGGRNVGNYQDLLNIDPNVTFNKNHRFRYKLLDKDDQYENILLMRYAPSAFKNVYANFGSYSADTGYSTFNFFFYFGPTVAGIMGVNGEENLFNRFAEVVSKKYLNTYLILSDSTGKFGVFKVSYAATSTGDYQLVLRVLMNADPNGTKLTGTTSFISGYYGQPGAAPVTYSKLEVITTSETLVTGTGLSTPYTIASGQYVYLNATGNLDGIVNQSLSSLPYVLKQVVTDATLDTSTTPNTLTLTKSNVKEVNPNVYTGLCSHHTRMFAVHDRLRSDYYRSTSILDLLGDFSTGYDYAYYVGHSQKFANHIDVEDEYVNG